MTAFERAEEAGSWLRERAEAPRVAIVLGSGLGGLASTLDPEGSWPFSDLPHVASPSVEGHGGSLIVGTVPGTGARVAALAGRVHLYEGHPVEVVCHPMRMLARWGVKAVVLTNAAGGVAEGLDVGDLVRIVDHLDLTASHPLRGPHDSRLGPRFPDMGQCWDKGLGPVVDAAAARVGVPIHRGVYAQMMGPTYETPAEVRMLRTLGADLVGMSTVVEAVAAHHSGLRVCGLSCVTNLAAGRSLGPLSHDEVQETADRVRARFEALALAALAGIDAALA